MAEKDTLTVDPDERVVEEVRCIYTGTPIPSIPSWYASVNVRFFCDAAKKNAPVIAAIPDIEVARPVAALSDSDADSDADVALDEIDDVEIDLDDADADPDLETTEE